MRVYKISKFDKIITSVESKYLRGDLVFLRDLSLWNVAQLENYVQLELVVLFLVKTGDYFVQFSYTLSQSRIEMVFDEVLWSIFNKIVTFLDSTGSKESIYSPFFCGGP